MNNTRTYISEADPEIWKQGPGGAGLVYRLKT